jgi:hypothetical protein
MTLPHGSTQGDNAMDTTAQSSAEQQQASQYARSLIEASLDPLVTIGPEGTEDKTNMLRPILLVEDSSKDVELILAGLEGSRAASAGERV